ncbi:zinc ribbon domain-containing protein [Mycobacterium sp. NPDC003449]
MAYPNRITGYASYVPANVLLRATVAEALGTNGAGRGARAVAGYDEDPITMAVAAVRRLPAPLRRGPLYFATSSPPFLDKSNATVVHTATGGDEWDLTVDLGGLRGGFAALVTAAATGGVAAMGDQRSGRSGSADEVDGGDGAAAFAFGDGDDAVAAVIGTASVSLELMDVWRIPGAAHAHTWEERFSQHVLGEAVRQAVAEVGKNSGFTDTPTTTVVAAPNRRFAAGTAAAVGAAGDADVQAGHRDGVGFCGAADPGLLLAAALDTAKAGDVILVVTAVGGVDALLVRALVDGPGPRPPTGRNEIGYPSFLTWRGLIEREPSRRPERPDVAAPPAHRNVGWKFGLEGSRCRSCGKVYLPAHRVCGECGALDDTEPYPVADLTGTVVALSTDSVSDSPSPPALAATVDFDQGGRIMMEVADDGPGLQLGDRVEMTFRRTYAVRGTPNYFWKARPTSDRQITEKGSAP